MLSVAYVAGALGAEAVGDVDLLVERPREPSQAGPHDLALAMDPKFAPQLDGCAAQAAVLWADADWKALGLKAAIRVGRHRYAMSGITKLFDLPYETEPGIHPSAVIHPTASIGEGASIGPFVVIGARAQIGRNARVLSHTTIYEDVVLGDDALVHSGVRIFSRVRIGDRVILQAGAVLGADGFSFVTPEPSAVETARASGGSISDAAHAPEWTRINSLGSVILGNDVEVGANSTLDRGTVSDTRIGHGTKIDNLVHVGHNVQVGETCLLCGLVGIAGSTVIGDRVVLGGTVGVADHVTIGSDVIAGGGAGITSNVKPGTFVMGYPARDRASYLNELKAIRRLPRWGARLTALEKNLSKPDETN